MKISLSQMRKLDTFEEVESPEIVYHMTNSEVYPMSRTT